MNENPPASADPQAPPPTASWKSELDPFLRPLRILGIHILLFLAARLTLYLAYRSDFLALSPSEVVFAFLRGFLFDLSVVLTFLGIPLFGMTLPFRWAQNRWLQGLYTWWSFGMFLLFAFVLAADLIYFQYVHRHVGPDLAVAGEDFHQTLELVLGDYAWALAAYGIGAVGLFFAWRRTMRPIRIPPTRRPVRIGIAVLFGIFLTLGARGGVGGRRINLFDAFDDIPQAGAYLILSGPFSLLHNLGRDRAPDVTFYPWEEALSTTQALLVSPTEEVGLMDYPIYRSRPARTTTRPNVILIVLESFSAEVIDTYRREVGMEDLGLTPRLDALMTEGVRFSRFYATGQKSMAGRNAILAGFPAIPGIPYLGYGMEQNRLAFLGHMARREGYETYLFQGAHRESMGGRTVAHIAGFQHFFGAEDYDDGGAKEDRPRTAYDEDLFREVHRQLSTAPPPFLAYVHTGSTHAPFNWRGKEWEKYPPDSSAHRYRNSIAYADHALGLFFAQSRKAAYFQDTVFIITADHTGGGTGRPEAPPSLFLIPCLVIAPDLKAAVDPRIGSLADVMPTIADRAGWSAPHSCVGRSLLERSDAPHRGALCNYGDLMLRIEEDGWILHSLERRIQAHPDREGFDAGAAERRLLSIVQVAATLLRRNRLCPPE